MSRSNTKNASKNDSQSATAEVLYQRLGNRWYAFSLIDDEVFVGSLTEEQIEGFDPELPLSPKGPDYGIEV